MSRSLWELTKLRSIRKSLTLSAAKKVALGLVLSHLDYANTLYTGLPQLEINKLQRIQNMAAKVVTKAGRYDSSTADLKELHWLLIHLRIKYKIALLVFRCINGIAPSYLCKLLTPRWLHDTDYNHKQTVTLWSYHLPSVKPSPTERLALPARRPGMTFPKI